MTKSDQSVCLFLIVISSLNFCLVIDQMLACFREEFALSAAAQYHISIAHLYSGHSYNEYDISNIFSLIRFQKSNFLYKKRSLIFELTNCIAFSELKSSVGVEISLRGTWLNTSTLQTPSAAARIGSILRAT